MKVKKTGCAVNSSSTTWLIEWEFLSAQPKTFHAHFQIAVIYLVVFYS